MKQFTILLALALFLAWPKAHAQNEGKDQYGYYWQNEASTRDTLGPVTYEWIDITTTGTKAAALGDDNFLGPLDIGFPFKYYWVTYQKDIYIGTNGYVMLGRGMNVASGDVGFPVFPTAGGVTTPNNYIGGMLCDLTFSDHDGKDVPGAELWYGKVEQDGKKMFVVSFIDVPFWTNETDDPKQYRGKNTFQIILADDYSIKINYKHQEGEVSSSYIRQGTNFLTMGMENNTGRDGSNWGVNKYPKANTAIKAFYPENSTYRFNDAEAAWIFNPDNYGSVVPIMSPARPVEIQVAVRNSGTSRATDITAEVSAFSYNGITTHEFQREQLSTGPLEPGESKVLTLSQKPTFTQNDVVRINLRTTLVGASDGYIQNNQLNAQLVVLDGSKDAEVAIGYDRFLVDPNAERAWEPSVQGDQRDGIAGLISGVYIEPPVYPATIVGVETGIIIGQNDIFNQQGQWQEGRPDSLSGFTVQIYEESGNGLVGDLIEEIEVDKSAYEGTYNEEDSPQMLAIRARLSQPIILQEGGLFVSAKINDPQPGWRTFEFIGADRASNQLKPKSFRTFEITGGHWAPHRDRPDLDFPIRLVVNSWTSRSEDIAARYVRVGQNYPNPAGDRLQVPYTVLKPVEVVLTLQNAVGQTVETRNLGMVQPGEHVLTHNIGNLPTGVYAYTLKVGGGQVSRKMMIAR